MSDTPDKNLRNDSFDAVTVKPSLPSIIEAKSQAKALRNRITAEGGTISHAEALERIANTHGYKDWNSFLAAMDDGPPRSWTPGSRVTGRYLSHPFTGVVTAINGMGQNWFRIAITLDDAIDVVTSDGFSNFRKHIRGAVGPVGETCEKTGDGVPHLILDIA